VTKVCVFCNCHETGITRDHFGLDKVVIRSRFSQERHSAADDVSVMNRKNPARTLHRRRSLGLLRICIALIVLGVVTAKAPAAQAAPIATNRFVAVPSPTRLLDTRSDIGNQPTGKPGANSIITTQVIGRAGVPTDAVAVVLNVTATGAEGAGFITVYPAGQGVPTASNINTERNGQTIPNLVTVPIGAGGRVAFFSSIGTHLVADIFGFYVPSATSVSGRYIPTGPTRAIDTRNLRGPLAAREVLRVPLPGVPADALAAVLNVTVTAASGPGYWTVFAAGSTQPDTSNLNVDFAGQTIPNQVLAPVGNGAVNIFSWAGGHVIVDVAGYYTGSSGPASSTGLFVPISPTRFLDTRNPGPLNPLGNAFKPMPKWVVEMPVIGRSGIPAAASALVMNTTLTAASRPGFVTVFPAGSPLPETSTLNADRVGQTIANHSITPLTPRGVSLFTDGGTHLIADVTGWFTGFPRNATVPSPNNVMPATPFPMIIRIPSIGLVADLHDGIDIEGLNDGPGHWPGTGLPGSAGNMAIFGHRVSHTHPFRNLDQLHPGDEITIESNGIVYRYAMRETLITGPDDAETIGGWTPTPTLTLVACHPPGSVTYRIVVRAVLVDIT
jgi:LPXTG-site transpeptidase (sortase) family protein